MHSLRLPPLLLSFSRSLWLTPFWPSAGSFQFLAHAQKNKKKKVNGQQTNKHTKTTEAGQKTPTTSRVQLPLSCRTHFFCSPFCCPLLDSCLRLSYLFYYLFFITRFKLNYFLFINHFHASFPICCYCTFLRTRLLFAAVPRIDLKLATTGILYLSLIVFIHCFDLLTLFARQPMRPSGTKNNKKK